MKIGVKRELFLYIIVGILLLLVISYGVANDRNKSCCQSCQTNMEEIRKVYNER